MRVEGGLAAQFAEPDGSSRPGADWTIGLKRGDATWRVVVRATLAAEASAATRADQRYQAQTVMEYLDDLLAAGWHPDQPRAHAIMIGNPRGGPRGGGADRTPERTRKPWWRFW